MLDARLFNFIVKIFDIFNYRILLSCILVFISWFSIFPQEYSYRHYTVKDGLIQNQVIAMFQDSKGYLWLGTKGGVSRFDGLKFKNYTVNDGLLSNRIFKFYEGVGGGIYFCSLIGVSHLFEGEIKTVLLNDTIKPDKTSIIIPLLDKMEFCVLNRNNRPVYIAP